MNQIQVAESTRVNRSRILHAAFFCPSLDGGWGLPMLLESPPGKGKTSIVRQYADRMAIPFMRLSPGLQGEGAFGVVPVPSADGRFLDFPPHSWTRPFVENGRGLVLVDEVTTADRALQPPMLALLDSKAIGGIVLPGGVRVWGACNAPEDAANGNDLAPALANRFGWLPWDTDASDHIRYRMARLEAVRTGKVGGMVQAPIDCATEEARVIAAWPDAYEWASAMQIGYLGQHPGELYAKPDASNPNASRAWASDRTWDLAVHWIASARIHGLTRAELDEGIRAFLGSSADGFSGYLDGSMQNPPAADVLDGKAQWKFDLARCDAASALLQSCVLLVLPQSAERRVDRAVRLWGLIDQVDVAARDVVVPVIVQAVAARLNIGDPRLMTASRRVLAENKDVLAAASKLGGIGGDE